MRKTTTGFQLLGSSQNPIQSPRSNSPDDILLSFDVKQIHTKKLKTLQQMKKLNRKFTSQDRMRECKTKDSSINTSNLARVQSQENSKVAQKVIPLDEYFKNSIFSKVFVSPNDNSAIRQIKLGKKNHSENQIFLRAQQKNGDSQGQNKILRIPVFGVIDHKIINLNQSQREIRNNIDDKLKEKLQATYYKSFQKTKRRLGNSRDIDIQLQNQPINQEQFSPSKMQKEEEMPEVDLIDSRLGFNPNGLKFRQANSQSQTHRSSRAKDYKLSASISSINPMIIQNIKPNFQNQTSPRDIHRKYYSKRFNAQSNLSIQKVDFASQMELDPSKLIPTKTLLQGNKINEDNLSGLLIPNGKYIYDENMKKLICNNINNSHNFTQQTFNTSIQNTPSSQQFQVQVRLKKYLEKSKHRPQFSVLKSKLQEFDSLLIDTKNAQGNRTHNTNTRQNSPQRKDSQIDKLMPLNNKLVTLINKRQSINMPNQKLQLTMTNPNSQFNYNNKLIKVLVDEETQKDSKDQQDQRRITPVMSKHSQKPQIEQLISKIDAKIPLENINQSMNREESKDCDTPDSMFTMGLDSFQSPLIGRTQTPGTLLNSFDGQQFNLEIQVINNFHHHHHYYNFPQDSKRSVVKKKPPEQNIDILQQISPWSTTTLQILEPDFQSALAYNKKNVNKHIHNHHDTILSPNNNKFPLSQPLRRQTVSSSNKQNTIFQHVSHNVSYDKQSTKNSNNIMSEDQQEEMEQSFRVQAIKVQNQDLKNLKKENLFFQERYDRSHKPRKYIPDQARTICTYQDQLKDFKDYVEKMCRSNFKNIDFRKQPQTTNNSPLGIIKLQNEEESRRNDNTYRTMRLVDKRGRFSGLSKPGHILDESNLRNQNASTNINQEKHIKCEGLQIKLDSIEQQDLNNQESHKHPKRQSPLDLYNNSPIKEPKFKYLKDSQKRESSPANLNETLTSKRKSLGELYQDLDQINFGYTKVKGFMNNNNDIFSDKRDYFSALQNPQMPNQLMQINNQKQVKTSYSIKRKSQKLNDIQEQSSMISSNRQTQKSITDDNKTLKDEDGMNLVNLLECHKIKAPKPIVKVSTRPSRALSSMTNPQNQDYYPKENEIFQNQCNEQLIIVGNSNEQVIKKIQLKKQYVPKNMSIAAKLIRNRQQRSMNTSLDRKLNDSQFSGSIDEQRHSVNAAGKSGNHQKLISIVYPLTDYAMGVEDKTIHQTLIGDKKLLSKKKTRSPIKDASYIRQSQV